MCSFKHDSRDRDLARITKWFDYNYAHYRCKITRSAAQCLLLTLTLCALCVCVFLFSADNFVRLVWMSELKKRGVNWKTNKIHMMTVALKLSSTKLIQSTQNFQRLEERRHIINNIRIQTVKWYVSMTHALKNAAKMQSKLKFVEYG